MDLNHPHAAARPPTQIGESWFQRHWPLGAAGTLALVVAAICITRVLAQTGGKWIYSLDDTYIHLAMAKTFAAHGVWGVTQASGFAAATSAPLYTLLLSGIYRLLGFHELAPLLVNLGLALLLLWWVARTLRPEISSAWCRFAVLASIVLFTPLIVQVVSGMEHTLHILLSLVFLWHSAELLARPAGREAYAFQKRESIGLFVLAALLPVVRYEALFLVFVVCALFVLRGRWLFAVALGVASWIPLCLVGWINIAHGSYFFPNSVLLKGNAPDRGIGALASFLLSGLKQLTANPDLYAIAIAITLLLFLQLRGRKTFWKRDTILLTILLAVLALHMQFARTGWLYRYEAYLVAAAILVLGITLMPWLQSRWRERAFGSLETAACLLLALLMLWPLAARARTAHPLAWQTAIDIHEQQYQMAKFLRQYYPAAKVAANDIGAITCFTEIECLDLFGLATIEVARAKRSGAYSTEFIAALATQRGVEIAIAYESWYQWIGGLPPEWTKVGAWQGRPSEMLGDTVVTFYAVKPEVAADLRRNLREFSPTLPERVKYREPLEKEVPSALH